MLSSSTASTHSLLSPLSLSIASLSSQPSPCIVLVSKPRFRRRQHHRFLPLSFVGVREHRRCSLLGFYHSREYYRGLHCGWSGFVRRCRDWDSEEDFALEAEILEFMKTSKKPEAFPSKKELVDAGRMDLVEGIVKKGGWLSLGWDLEEEEEGAQENGVSGLTSMAATDSDSFQKNKASAMEEIQGSEVSTCPYDDTESAASSGGSLEMETTEHETGIEGILSRLEKERNLTFGFGVGENEDRRANNNENDEWQSRFSKDATVAGLSRSSRSSSFSPKKAISDDPKGRLNQGKYSSDIDDLRNSDEPETWRSWSIQRAGFSDMGFKDAEIPSSESNIGGSMDNSKDEIPGRERTSEPNGRNELYLHHENISNDQLRRRLQHLELELSSVLRSVQFNADETALQKDHEGSSDDLQKLSDAWEFQENEIMNSQSILRSTRAKLAVLEGKMALAIIKAQKIMEEKQKRIDDARRASQLLRASCIVWPNSASEVLLAGSFDGWATKRKMMKSSTGIFSLWLQLYPGRYEIKFIVDGEWRIDPLRPIVKSNGFENNLLIIN